MDVIEILHRMLHKGVSKFPLIAVNGQFDPKMVQRPLIDAGNTGRYFLDAMQVAFNSPAGGGTLAPNGPGHGGPSLDVTAHHYATYGGMGSIPQTPGTQGLVTGFRDNGL